MSATSEQVKCRCGTRMIPTSSGILICENCDQVQPQQPYGIAREKTKQDVRYAMYWLAVEDAEYKDNRPDAVINAEAAKEQAEIEERLRQENEENEGDTDE